jgi:localization factor PodJL
MKPGVPWSVKGIEPEAREVAKDAARRSGMTLGEWLNTAINEQAVSGEADNMTTRSARQPASSSADSFERAATRLEDIAAQLAKIATRGQDTAPAALGGYEPEARQKDTEQVTRILGRIETNERQSIEAFTAVNERLATMGRQFAQAAKVATNFKPEDHPSFQALEKAVRNIVDHLESSEKRTRDNFKTLQERMADMSSRAATAPNEQVLRQLPAFAQLEQRMGEIAKRVEETDARQAQTPSLPDVVRQELHSLANRIDTVRDTAESLAARAQTQAVQASQQELHTIEERILGLLREAQATFAKGSVSDAELQGIRGDVDALNKRIDQSRQGTASDKDVHALRVAVDQLAARVSQGPEIRRMADMDRRLVELAQRLNDSQSQPQPGYDDLERRVGELDAKLNDAMATRGGEAANAAIVEQLSLVSERMDRAEKQMSHFETIESAIRQLYDGLEQTRSMTAQVAEDTANRVASQMIAQMPQSSGSSAEIAALEQGLQAVREASLNSDQRNQETLEALHETLEHIVTKLSELESVAVGQRIASAAGVVSEAPMHQASIAASHAEMPVQQSPAYSPAPQAERPVINPYESSMSSYDEFQTQQDQPQDEDRDEETREPRLEIPAQASEDTPAQTAAVAAAPAADADDFINAARRAAQAAQQQKGGLTGRGEKGTGSLLGRLAGKNRKASSAAIDAARVTAGEARVPPEIRPATQTARSPRYKLLLIGLALLSVVGAYSYSQVFKVLGTRVDTPPPAIETPAPAPETPKVQGQPQSSLEKPVKPAELDANAVLDDTSFGQTGVSEPDVKQEMAAAAPAAEVAAEVAAPEKSEELLTASLPKESVSEIVAGQNKSSALEQPPAGIGPAKLVTAATSGDPAAQFVVASRFMDGERVPRDFGKAAYWYGKAAEAGLAPAQYRMATLYERGKGVEQSMKMALDWYERAATGGNVRAMHNAAVIAAGNDAGKPDYAKAFKYFSLAAEHGLKDSQFNLAILFERGLGVQAKPSEALFWYLAAAAQNDQDAQRRAEKLAKGMKPSVVGEVKTQLKNWKPMEASKPANAVSVDDSSWQDTSG